MHEEDSFSSVFAHTWRAHRICLGTELGSDRAWPWAEERGAPRAGLSWASGASLLQLSAFQCCGEESKKQGGERKVTGSVRREKQAD